MATIKKDVEVYTARIMDNRIPGVVDTLKEKVLQGGGTIICDMRYLLGFAYLVETGTADPLRDEDEEVVLVQHHPKKNDD